MDVNGLWTLTPQAQLVYSAVDSNFSDSFGTRVTLSRNVSLNGRLGLALDHQQNLRDARGELARANVYGITNVYYEFLNGTAVDVAGTNLASGYDRLAAGFGFGGSYNWGNDKYAVYGEALVKTGFADDYSVGGTAGFRAKW
ncbi:MAG: outer rane autotransporter barrel domain protein [Tardiphaga sp.]|nr:outer rane autotransporter barrel domain protein [Tardiphaga sp.]